MAVSLCDVLGAIPGVGTVTCKLDDLGGALDKLNPWYQLQALVAEAVGKALSAVGTLWVHVPAPDLGASGNMAAAAAPAPAGLSEFSPVLGWVRWVGFFVAVLSLLVLAGWMAWRGLRRDGGGEVWARSGWWLVGTSLVSGGLGLTASLLGDRPMAAGSAIEFLQSSTWWLMVLVAGVSVVAGAARMVWSQRDAGAKARDMAEGLLGLMLTVAVGTAVVQAGLRAGDAFSVWVLDQSLGGACGGASVAGGGSCFVDNLLLAKAFADFTALQGMGILVVVLLGLVALLMALGQVLLMIVRNGLVVVLVGLWPLARAGFGFEFGRSWSRRYGSWLLAAVLYKPAAALIYAAGFKLAGVSVLSGAGAVYQVLSGLVLLLLALVALPALMKLIVPPAAGVSSSAGGGLLAGVAGGSMVVQSLMAGPPSVGPAGEGPGGGAPSGPSGSGSVPAAPPVPAGPAGSGPGGPASGAPGGSGMPAAGGPAAAGSGASGAGGGAAAGSGGAAAGGSAASAGAAAGSAGGSLAVQAGLQAASSTAGGAKAAAEGVAGGSGDGGA